MRVGWTPQLRHRRGRPSLSRGVRDLGYPPRPTHPDGRPLLARPGAPAGPRLRGPRVRAGAPRERCDASGSVSRRPPSLAGRRAAFLAGGEEGAVALASASRSSPAHAPARRARAQPRSSSRTRPSLSCRRTRRRPHTARSPSVKQQVTAAARWPTRKLFRRHPRGCHGCEPGSDSLAPVAAGWTAKAWDSLETPSSGEGEAFMGLR